VIPRDVAEKVYTILVEEAGATEGYRQSFVEYLGNCSMPEFRFIGTLGFGGKFYADGLKWYVACYREDQNADRNAAVDRINAKLTDLRREHISGGGINAVSHLR
jgi:hypothetical protein